MAERALRGSRLGAQSYETDAGIEMAPRQSVTYDCARGHRFAMPFSLEADVPEVWECTVCGSEALRMDGTRPEPKAGKPARTHWDMLLERRSVKELEVLLAERLEQLRAGAPGRRRSTGPARAPDPAPAPSRTLPRATPVRVPSLSPSDAARTFAVRTLLAGSPRRRGSPPVAGCVPLDRRQVRLRARRLSGSARGLRGASARTARPISTAAPARA